MIPENFDSEIHDLVREIPAGRIVTYGQLARLVGAPNQSRRVGRAMGTAPAGVPCHRVVASGGRLVPGWREQRTLLEAEGVAFRANGCADLRSCNWELLFEEQPRREAIFGSPGTFEEQ